MTDRNTPPFRRRLPQRGISLVAGLVMLVLISLLVTASYTLSTSNSQAVSNQQFRKEAIAAANKGIEQSINTIFFDGFNSLPTANTIFTLDINNDTVTDYSVAIGIPVCTRAIFTSASGSSSPGATLSSASLGTFSGGTDYWDTQWDIAATVTDTVSGTFIVIHQGLRASITPAQKLLVCP